MNKFKIFPTYTNEQTTDCLRFKYYRVEFYSKDGGWWCKHTKYWIVAFYLGAKSIFV